MHTQTGTRSRQVREAQATPYSRTAAKLIEQLQAEAQAATLQALSAKDGIAFLRPLDRETLRVSVWGDEITLRDDTKAEVCIHRKREEPESWRAAPHMRGYWHPSRWFGRITSVDNNGNQWSRNLNPMVCDDFGNLVEVQA